MIVLRPPVSKSDAQRALVLADIVGVPFDRVVPGGESLPRDVKVLRGGLEALRTPGEVEIDCHDGGAPFRFLLTQAAILPGRVTRFIGTPRLGERPHAALVDSLRVALGVAGVRIEELGKPWPLRVIAAPTFPQVARFDVTGVESSQFASSLLLGAARVAFVTGQPCEVEVHGALTSEGYLELTREWVRRAGFTLGGTGGKTSVTRGSAPATLEVPGDWSSLTYLLALAWKSGARVERVDFTAAHPDREIVAHLESIGLSISRDALVSVTGQAQRGFAIDAQVCPDAVPTLAAIAAVLPAPSVVTRVGILRHKESDRLAATRALLTAAGASSVLEGETLTISPGALHDFSFDAHDDHRMAMSAAVLSYLGGVKLSLTGREAVAKSFPEFWTEFAKVSP